MKTQNFLFERDMDREDIRIAEEIEAFERWLEKPWFERFNAEILDAGCAAANCIARGIYDLGYAFKDDNDIEF